MKTATILTVVLVILTVVLVVAPVAFGQCYNPRDWEARGNGYGGHGNNYRGHQGNDWSRVAIEAIRVAGAVLEQPRYAQQPMCGPRMYPGQQYQQQQYRYPQQYPPQPASQVPMHLAIYGYGQKQPVAAPQSTQITVVNNNINRSVVVLQGQPPVAVAQATLPEPVASAPAPAAPAVVAPAPVAAPAVPAAAPAVAQATPPVPATLMDTPAPATAAVPAATVAPVAEPSYLLMFGIMAGGFLLMVVILAIVVGLAYLIFSRRRGVAPVAPSGPVRPRAPTPAVVAPATPPAPAAPASGGPVV